MSGTQQVTQIRQVHHEHTHLKSLITDAQTSRNLFFFSMNTIILLYINFTDIDRINGNTSRSLS